MADEPHDEPVHVTGEERRHPAYRLLARAMLALARVRQDDKAAPDLPAQDGKPSQEEADNG